MRNKHFTTSVVLLLKKQRQEYSSKTKWNASQLFEEGGEEEPSFEKELSPSTLPGSQHIHSTAFQKSFRSSWVSLSQRMFPLRKQHIPGLFLSCQLLFLITGWAGFGLSSGQQNGLSALLITMFCRQQSWVCCTWCSGPKWAALLTHFANLANLLTLLWACCTCAGLGEPLQSAAFTWAPQQTPGPAKTPALSWNQLLFHNGDRILRAFLIYLRLFETAGSAWTLPLSFRKMYFYIYAHLSRFNCLWIGWLRVFRCF